MQLLDENALLTPMPYEDYSMVSPQIITAQYELDHNEESPDQYTDEKDKIDLIP